MEQLEGHIRDVFDEIRMVAPMVNHLSVAITEFNNGTVGMWGFINSGRNVCQDYNSVAELKHIVARKEILFRRFEL